MSREAAGEQRAVNVGAGRWGTERERNWPGTLMAVGIFIALFTLFWTGPRTLIPVLDLFRALAFCCIIGTLVPYVLGGWRMGMAKLEWFLFNVLAVGPITISALLWLNTWVHGPITWGSSRFGNDVVLILTEPNGDQHQERFAWPGHDEFGREELNASTTGMYRVGAARGCLGYWVVVERSVCEQDPCY